MSEVKALCFLEQLIFCAVSVVCDDKQPGPREDQGHWSFLSGYERRHPMGNGIIGLSFQVMKEGI